MLKEEDIVSKIYAEINWVLAEIRNHCKGLSDDEIISSWMECIDHHDVEWVQGYLIEMTTLIRALNALGIPRSLRDPAKESLIERYRKIVP